MDDADEFQSQICTSNNNYPRLSTTTTNNNGTKLAPHCPPEDEDHDATHTLTAAATDSAEPQSSLADSMFRGWHNSSRIFRVSRASGGKDRHSKVLTSKGLRDRRVRLSVSTAIQFYDLQDRLGYDQPSKAVEWLIKAAADSIAELPSLHGPFPETPRQVIVDSQLGFESAEAEAQQQKRNQSISKSASSTSETSKGSGLSLTQTDVRVNQRVKARERARERAKEKECESEQAAINVVRRQTPNPISSHPKTTTSSFTELLTGGSSPNSTPMISMDYFTNSGLISGHHVKASQPTLTSHYHHHHHQAAAACLFLGQTQVGNSMRIPTAFHLSSGEHHQHHDVQHLSFGQENNLIPVGNEYDLNFRISSSPSSLAGYNNRGTLQSNLPSAASSMLHHNFQRYAASMEGSSVPAFFVTAQASSSNPHHFSSGFDGGLHLCYGDGGRHADHKDKGKK